MPETPSGTANILRQHSEYEKLQNDYSTETANTLTAKSLERNGVDATPNDVSSWHKINSAATQCKLDIPTERKIAETVAHGVANAMIASINASPMQPACETLEPVAEQDDDDSIDDERPTIDDMYGYDDPEDNAEAAFDDVLKAQERAE